MAHLVLGTLCVFVLMTTMVNCSQCCTLGVSNKIKLKWQEAMSYMDANSKIGIVASIVHDLQARYPLTADVIKGRRIMDPAFAEAGEKHAYLKLIQEMGIMVDLLTNAEGLDRHIKHYVLTNHVHYGSELRALGDAMEAIFWAMFQISGLGPSTWYSCVFEIINLLQFHAAKAVGDRVYARCDVTPDTGDPTEPIHGTIVFEQSMLGGSTVIRGKLAGFDTTDDDIKHGFHIHAGTGTGNMCKDTASHYNPYSSTHGAPYEQARHVGDLGNISEDDDGVADIYRWDNKASLLGAESIIGRTVVIHSSYDSFRRPSTYGPRAACCVIIKMQTPTGLD